MSEKTRPKLRYSERVLWDDSEDDPRVRAVLARLARYRDLAPTPLAPEEDDASKEQPVGGDAANEPGKGKTAEGRRNATEGESVEDDGLALSDAVDEAVAREINPEAFAVRRDQADAEERADALRRARSALAALPRNPVSQDQLGELEDFCIEQAREAERVRRLETYVPLANIFRGEAKAFRAVLQRIREGKNDG